MKATKTEATAEIPPYNYADEWYGYGLYGRVGLTEAEKLRSCARYAVRYSSGPAVAPLNRILGEIDAREQREREEDRIRRLAREEAKKVCRRRWWA